MTDSLVSYLESFNRKERFFLVGRALGNPDFRLCDEFRGALERGFELAIPPSAFVAMDYHLDWLYGALASWMSRAEGKTIHPNGDGLIEANQEDADLIVAYDTDVGTHILLLEAKGYTGWTNQQMTSKATRLRAIFGADGKAFPGVLPHLGLVSPREQRRLDVQSWPPWMAPGGTSVWIELPLPKVRRRVQRCDAKGVVTADGEFFEVVSGG